MTMYNECVMHLGNAMLIYGEISVVVWSHPCHNNELYRHAPLFTGTAYMEKLLGTIVKDELSSIVSPVQLYYIYSTPALESVNWQ